jgi:hypothetical protein
MHNYEFLLHPRSTSQAHQESFALNLNEWKSNGYYVEIGGCHPTENSNTNVLETEFGWRGFSVEIEQDRADLFKSRNNPCIQGDATELDYLKIFQDLNMPNQIDYLQVDVEPAENTLKSLKKVLVDGYRFSVITFEHDLYANSSNQEIMYEAREILFNKGYEIVAPLVKDCFTHGAQFEDWFIDPTYITTRIWQDFQNQYNQEDNSLFKERYA